MAKIYQVGGSVRDQLMGLMSQDRDFVVVGATVQDLLDQGYQPVGRDFPVFLHPETREEYALARTERKTGRGYSGFTFHTDSSVTLEEDLRRRDLTINAIALDEAGHLIDPYGGVADIAARVFRHVSEAFAEDPLRVLRLARFAARFTDFSVAPKTLALCRHLVETGEMRELVAERVWQELSRGLMEQQASRMFQVLADCGALAELAPEWADGALDLAALNYATQQQRSLAIRFAVTGAKLSATGLAQMLTRWRPPRDCSELALQLLREQATLTQLDGLFAADIHDVLMRCDALRRPERFVATLDANDAIHHAPLASRAIAMRALAAMQSVPAAAIAQSVPSERIRAALRDVRITAIQAVLTI